MEKSEEDMKDLLQSSNLKTKKVDQEVKQESLPQTKQSAEEASKWTDSSSYPQSFVGKEVRVIWEVES